MQHIKIISLILFFSNCCYAQTLESLLQKESIQWIVETETEYILDKIDYRRIHMNLEIKNNLKSTRGRELIKWDPFNTDCKNGSDQFFTESLIRNLQYAHFKAEEQSGKNDQEIYKFLFESSELMDSLLYTDTPEIVKQKVTEANYRVIPQIYSYRITQLWYYEKELDRIDNIITNFSPIIWNYNGEVLLQKYTPFSIKNPDDSKEGFDLNNVNITWIIRSSDDIEFNAVNILKGDFEEGMEEYIFNEPKNGKRDLFRCEKVFNCSEELNREEKDKIFEVGIDSSIFFQPSERIEYKEIPAIEFKEIKKYRVNQYFYYNQKERTLNSKLVEIAPIFERKRNYWDPESPSKMELKYYLKNDNK